MRRLAAVLLRVVAWGVLVGGGLGALSIVGVALSSGAPARAALGALALGTLIALAAWAMHQVCIFHVRDIDALGDSRFVMFPIASILARTGGEVFALWWCSIGVGGVLLMVVAGPSAQALAGAASTVPGLQGLAFGSLLGSIWVLAWCAVVAVIGLVSSYLWAEGLVVVVDIANRVQQIASATPVAAATAAAPIDPPLPAPPAVTPVRQSAVRPAPPPAPVAAPVAMSAPDPLPVFTPRPTPAPTSPPTPVPTAAPAFASWPTPAPDDDREPDTGPVPIVPDTVVSRPTPLPTVETVPLSAVTSPATVVITPVRSSSDAPTSLPMPAPPLPTPPPSAPAAPGSQSTVILGRTRICAACGAPTALVMAKFCEECGARL